MLLALTVGCPATPGIVMWLVWVGGVAHVLVSGMVLATAWEVWQDRERRRLERDR